MQFGFLLEQVVNGLVLGGYYLLIALGLSLIFSASAASSISRMARSMRSAPTSPSRSRNISASARRWCCRRSRSALLGILFERFILRRFYDADPILSLLVTFGLAMVAEQAIRIIWGAPPISAAIPQAFAARSSSATSCSRAIGC